MKSQLPKVLHRIGGLTLIERVLRTAAALIPASITLVVGHGADEVKAVLAGRTPTLQFVDAGAATRHRPRAAANAAAARRQRRGIVVLLSGDVPLLSGDSLTVAARRRTPSASRGRHRRDREPAAALWLRPHRPHQRAHLEDRRGARRLADAARRSPRSIPGIYAFDLAPLFAALDGIGTANKQGEYYLPDLVAIYRKQKRTVATWTVERAEEIRGINSRTELAEVSSMVRQQKNEELMAAGVTLIDPATTYVDADVVVGADTVIHPCVFLEGSTKIGAACEIHSGARIVNSTIGDRVCVRNHTVVTDSTVESGSFLGPFAHIRPGSAVGEDAHIGNFVELKKTTMGKGAKANHLAYLGDATIGAKTNVGAGTITCNYDGEKKHQTVIGKGVFVGSNSTLVAPVTLGRWRVHCSRLGGHRQTCRPARSAIGRARQENKDGWVAKKTTLQEKSKGDLTRLTMCGIIGYIGPKPVVPVILDGLRRLEYRGYDSAGVAVVHERRRSKSAAAPAS